MRADTAVAEVDRMIKMTRRTKQESKRINRLSYEMLVSVFYVNVVAGTGLLDEVGRSLRVVWEIVW